MTTSADHSQVTHPHIERRRDIQGGRPIIKGTCFPVTSIVQNYRRGLSIEEILHQFPHLSPAQVHDALSYYYDHRGEMDRDIAALTDVARAAKQFAPTLRPNHETHQGLSG